ncbi:MAG: electron transfer flavoprotein alpha subunit [Saprospiraceae bacterium]|jgi:electron transfer flavoprotein alpha subunit
MSILVYIENTEGILKKGTLEAVSYAAELAKASGASLVGVSIGEISNDELNKVGNHGLSEVIKLAGDKVNHQSAASQLNEIASSKGVSTVVLANSWQGKGVGPRLAVKMGAGLVTEAVELPTGKAIKKKAFSGKAFVNVEMTKDKNVIAVAANSFGLKEISCEVSITDDGTTSSDDGLQHISYNRDTSKLSLTDAEIVVSAGRGLKGPENWGMIEELATVLGAATACSKPVSDADWRPHHEHVGQTGITISPNLYFAIGISGAIQHLAGVSSSKKIVVINTDPEAPFFKAADYGIVGDAFEVVPKLVEAIRKAV